MQIFWLFKDHIKVIDRRASLESNLNSQEYLFLRNCLILRINTTETSKINFAFIEVSRILCRVILAGRLAVD